MYYEFFRASSRFNHLTGFFYVHGARVHPALRTQSFVTSYPKEPCGWLRLSSEFRSSLPCGQHDVVSQLLSGAFVLNHAEQVTEQPHRISPVKLFKGFAASSCNLLDPQ